MSTLKDLDKLFDEFSADITPHVALGLLSGDTDRLAKLANNLVGIVSTYGFNIAQADTQLYAEFCDEFFNNLIKTGNENLPELAKVAEIRKRGMRGH